MDAVSKGYTSTRLGVLSRLTEASSLLTVYRQGPTGLVKRSVEQAIGVLDEIALVQGKPVRDMDILEIGSGQKSIQLAVMSQANRAIGIDRESSNDGLSVRSIVHTIQTDGAVRAAKTVARKAMGFDRQIRNEFAKQMGMQAWQALNVQQMDASRLSFPDASFDIVFSRAVFEHIENPVDVLREIKRVIRPGGVFYCLLHLYSSYSGCHDIRIFAKGNGNLPLWPHLREDHKHKVIQNTYLNRLRLGEWRSLLNAALPGVQVDALMDDSDPSHLSELEEIRKRGELADYSDEELLTVTLKAVWNRGKQ
jgi:SAM-dependent methyltransferase